ncbi:hypothetical protein H5410_002614 [Solanum commersonii]|uniref:Uncharacterized protein n=1 Tax=Solanum commersonii TaxID=4109 RepID=A0A9J6B2F3_SOLCO|nr:hypothetical protein H5410_002614 [Solanum commersonii]
MQLNVWEYIIFFIAFRTYMVRMPPWSAVKTTAREGSRGLMPGPGGVQLPTTDRSTDRGPYHSP